MAQRITDHFYFMSERIKFLIDSIIFHVKEEEEEEEEED
jgi:hypothetical protein